jgi:hypothetical protein
MLVYNSYKRIYEDLQLQATLVHIVLVGSDLCFSYLGFFRLFRGTLAKVEIHWRNTSECCSCYVRRKKCSAAFSLTLLVVRESGHHVLSLLREITPLNRTKRTTADHRRFGIMLFVDRLGSFISKLGVLSFLFWSFHDLMLDQFYQEPGNR